MCYLQALAIRRPLLIKAVPNLYLSLYSESRGLFVCWSLVEENKVYIFNSMNCIYFFEQGLENNLHP